jgi:hypothetical protein
LVIWLTMVILGWVWLWLGPYLGLVKAYNQTQNNHGYLVILVMRLNTAEKTFFQRFMCRLYSNSRPAISSEWLSPIVQQIIEERSTGQLW